MKRLMIGIAAASLLSALSFAAQAEERGARHGFSRTPSHASSYSRSHGAASRHYREPRRHYAPHRHYGHYRPYRHGYRAHLGWDRRYGAQHYSRHHQRPYRYGYWH